MSLLYKLSIDIARPDYLSGWCFHRWKRNRPVELQLCQPGRVIGEVTADKAREDLAALKIHPTGSCGFELVIDSEQAGDNTVSRQLRVKESGQVLAVIDGETRTVQLQSSRFRGLLAKPAPVRKPNILFMHIPKTAGTSFNTLVRTLLSPEEVVSHIEAMDVSSYPQLSRRYRFISGHLRFGVFKEHFLGEGTELFSITREPYSHLHSHLKWMEVSAGDTPDNSPKFTNRVIHGIGRRIGETDFTSFREIDKLVRDLQGMGAPFFDNMHTRHFLDGYVDQVTEKHLETAVRNSAHFSHIGSTEEYPAFISRFAHINGLKQPDAVPTLNRSTSSPLFDFNDPAIRELLLPLVCHDLALHDYVRRTFRG